MSMPPARLSPRLTACAVSVGAHLMVAVIAVWITSKSPVDVSPHHPRAATTRHYVVWLPSTGDGRRAGSGGDQTPTATTARLPGQDPVTVPASASEWTEQSNTPPPPISMFIPAQPMAGALDIAVGLIGAPPAIGTDRGPGSGSGAGTGKGSGSGEGEGADVGRGISSGTGAGVTLPQLVKEVRPNYTAEAMRAKTQGVVLLECVVMPDGTVGEARILRSLDPAFGLDQEALKAVKQWRFVPGKRNEEPVLVVVTIEVAFTLR
jgi:protein TonB